MYQPKYSISQSILRSIGTIEAAREVIHNAPLVPAWEKKFQDDAVVRQVHHGTHLEGNELNLSEAAQVVAGNQIVGRPRDIQEVINYRNVIDYLNKQTESSEEKRIFVSLEMINYLHKLTTHGLLEEAKSGKVRTTQVVIKNSETGEVSFRPPPAVEVPTLLDVFIQWLNHGVGDTHPVLASGVAQYELVRIHPYVDGNGRVARAIATLVLYQLDYDIRRFFSLEEYYDKNAVTYYTALQSVQQRNGDLTLWLEYFAEGLAIELNRIKEKVNKLSTDLHMKDKLGGQQVYLSERQIKIVEHIQSIGYLQNKMFSGLFPMVSEDTILREIQDLIAKGILVKKGKTKGARYIFTA